MRSQPQVIVYGSPRDSPNNTDYCHCPCYLPCGSRHSLGHMQKFCRLSLGVTVGKRTIIHQLYGTYIQESHRQRLCGEGDSIEGNGGTQMLCRGKWEKLFFKKGSLQHHGFGAKKLIDFFFPKKILCIRDYCV